MKSVIFISILFFICLSAANAQQFRHFSIQDRVAQLKDSLALSDSQTVIVDSILTNSMQKARSMDVSEPDRRDAMMQIMKETDAAVEKVLTKDQQVIYERMLAERRAEMQQRMMNRRNYDNN